MPLLIIGSLFIIISDFPVEAYQTFMAGIFGEGWGDFVWNDVFVATTSLIAVIATFGIAKSLVDSYDLDGTPAGIMALSSFFVLLPLDVETWGWNADLFGSSTLFMGMIVALLIGELYRIIVKKNLVIKLPDSVPPSISNSFVALVPAGAAIVLSLIVKMIFRATPFGDLGTFINAVVSAPLTIAGTSYPGALFATFIEQLLWSFGIHGSSVVTAVMEPIWLNANLENLAAFQAGATLPVVVYMLCFARSKMLKDLGRLSIAPGIFNINEPVVFGLPIVLNPFLMIPFILSPLVIFTVSYVGMYLNIFPRMVGVSIPWTTPYLISGYLATGGRFGGVLLQIVNFVVAFIIWLPFIRSWDKKNVAMEQAEQASV